MRSLTGVFVVLALAALCASAGSTTAGAVVAAEVPEPVKADRDGDGVFDDLEAALASKRDADWVEVIVTLRAPADAPRLAALRERAGPLRVGRSFSIIPAFSATVTKAQVRVLARLPIVAHVEENSVMRAANDGARSSFGVLPARTALPGLDGDRDGNPGTYSAGDLVAAVIDSGIDAGHADLDGGKVLAWKDWVNGRPTPYDDNGHGTHVAATIAGTGEGRADRRYAGVAPGAGLVGLKVLNAQGSGLMSNVTAAIDWVVANRAAYGIEAINLSLTTSGCSNGSDATSQAVNRAVAHGVAVFVAAGNSGPNECTIPSPSAAASAVTVGAMADLGANGFQQAWFSGRGPTADGRVKPDVSGPGVAVTSADAGTGSGYVAYDGTSMAAPFTAGVALLMLDQNPSLTPGQIKTALMSTAHDWGRGGSSENAGTTGTDVDYGAGRLDAFAALKAVGAPLPGSAAAPAHAFHEGVLSGTGAARNHYVDVVDTTVPVAGTLIVPDTGGFSGPNFDLYLYRPDGSLLASSRSSRRQEQVGALPTAAGRYRFRVVSYRNAGDYFLDVSAGTAGGGAPGDTTPPTVTSTSPPDGSGSVGVGSNVSATFSEPMDQGATQGAFTLVRASDSAPVAGSFAWSGTTLVFDPGASLAAGTAYRATVATGARDLAGNALAAAETWTFTTTAPAVDTTAPTIVSRSPADGATGISTGTNVTVAFSEAMDQAAAQGAFTLVRAQDGAPVAGGFSWAGNTLTFDPGSDLAAGTAYRATVSTAARDTAGNALASASSWTFTTASAPGGGGGTGLSPFAVVVQTGTLVGGGHAGLAADDGAFLSVRSAGSFFQGTSAWYGRIAGVPAAPSALSIAYAGANTASCTQTVSIWSWTTGAWVSLDARTVGTTEVALSGLAPPGSPAQYVSGGELRVRVSCAAFLRSWTVQADVLRADVVP